MFRVRPFHTFKPSSIINRIVNLDDGSIVEFLKPQRHATLKEELPPRVRTFPTRSILSKENIAEMKRLRQDDPHTNTVLQLAKKFNTFPGFVLKNTKCPLERKVQLEREAARDFEVLPLSKKKRGLDRLRRKALW